MQITQAAYTARVRELDEEIASKTEWALQIDRNLAAKSSELAATVKLLDTAEATVIERTEWALDLQSRVSEIEAQLAMIRQSRWVKLGRTIGAGPQIK